LPGGVVLKRCYNGAKGTRLDTERALVGSGNQPFIYESSEGDSVFACGLPCVCASAWAKGSG